ncbi:uncharacterized protein LOC127705571 isoform X2 [Mytilus californianus]|uniref:uncharacterized protein LOC127705571 isoform X2 n=1 Tax=Mytilus californianus TaxID=6549 RepID=UPI0022478C74|nr:uncharacterized protein LOC127705571 isoform X2 [Mytilus californianus]
MFICLKIFVFFTLILTFGYGQQVDLSKQKDLILKLHNGYRGLQGASNMKKMRWSDKLAKEAEKWVGRCWYQFLAGTNGENMFYLESALPDQVLVERAIDTWYSEKYGWRRSGDCTDACSYTQVVWSKTDEVGCAAHRCAKLNLVEEFVNNGWFITCLYNPKGNTLGQMPFEAGNPCTLCDLGERCMDKLCVKSRPSQTRVTVQNRRPPRPRVKPILSFDDVQKQKRVSRQLPRNWWSNGPVTSSFLDSFNRGPVTPSFLDSFNQNSSPPKKHQIEEVITIRPTDPIPKLASRPTRQHQLWMHESAFGLEELKQQENVKQNETLDSLVLPSEDPLKTKSLYDDSTKPKNFTDDIAKDISPVYAQMTINGPVFSFRGTVFKSHRNEQGNEPEKLTKNREITTKSTTTSTTTTTTTTPTPTRKIPKWFELKISQTDDSSVQQNNKNLRNRAELPEQIHNRGNQEINTNGKPINKSQRQKSEDISPTDRNPEKQDRRRNRIPSRPFKPKVRFVFKTSVVNQNEEFREAAIFGSTTMFPEQTANSNQRTDFNKPVSATIAPTPPPNPLLCPDSDTNCKHWTQYCSTNDYVAKNCPGSCDTCPTPPPDPPCPDLDPSCHLWQTYCAHNDYVRDHCFNTCNNCTYAVQVTPPANGLIQLQSTTTTTVAPCIDKDQYCPGWKNLCYTDEYVKFNCKKSCTFCK